MILNLYLYESDKVEKYRNPDKMKEADEYVKIINGKLKVKSGKSVITTNKSIKVHFRFINEKPRPWRDPDLSASFNPVDRAVEVGISAARRILPRQQHR